MNYVGTKKKLYVPLVFALIACFLMSGQIFAQTTMVTLEGRITDNEGAALPGATVTVKNGQGNMKSK